MKLNDDQAYVLEHLRSTQPEVLRQLQKSGTLEEYLELKAKEGQDLRQFMRGGKKELRSNEQVIVNEVVRAQLSELPAEHPDSPYYDAYKAMERDNPSD